MPKPTVVASIDVRDEAGAPWIVDVLRALVTPPGSGMPPTFATILRLRVANRQVWRAGALRFRDGDGRIYVADPPAAP